MTKQNEEIAELNSRLKVTIAPSAIHGVGVFPLRSLKKDEKLWLDMYPKVYSVPFGSFNKLFPEVRQNILAHWPTIAAGSKFMFPDVRYIALMNHSENPNYDPITDTLLCDVSVAEEITEDYRLIKGAAKVFDFI